MNPSTTRYPTRVIVVDGDPTLPVEIRRILEPLGLGQPGFEVDWAPSGGEGLMQAERAAQTGQPYALALVGLRTACGGEATETARRFCGSGMDLQVVMGWPGAGGISKPAVEEAGGTGNLTLLRLPFEGLELLLLVRVLTEKWRLARVARSACDAAKRPAEPAGVLPPSGSGDSHLRWQSERLEAMGRFAASLAHDFNNLLTVLQGRVGLVLSRETPDSVHHRSLTAIAQAADKAADLVHQLLLFSGNHVSRRRAIDLGSVLQSALAAFEGSRPERIEMRLGLPEVLPPIKGDAVLLQQVLLALFANACEAMPDGGTVVITAEAAGLEPGALRLPPGFRSGQHVCVRVVDAGRGIRAQDLPHVFDPFFTTKDVREGAGFGLSVAHGVVRQHKGWIDIESVVGKGTSVALWFPAGDQEAVPDLPAPVSPAVAESGHGTILVVEDHEAVCSFVAEVLRSHGYTVLTAASGEEAIEIFSRDPERIDLLLADMLMPGGMTGADVAQQLAAQNARLKVILTSGYLSAKSPGRPVSVQGFGFLAKPYEPVHLLRFVDATLRRSPPTVGDPRPPSGG